MTRLHLQHNDGKENMAAPHPATVATSSEV